MTEKFFYSIIDAAEALAIKRSKLWELISEGTFDVRKLGSRTVITAVSLSAYAERLPRAEMRSLRNEADKSSSA